MRCTWGSWVLGAMVVLGGCADGDDDTGNASAESDGTASATVADDDGSASLTGMMTTVSTSVGESGTEDSGTGEDTGTTGPVEPQPNGSTCMDNAECESGFCFYIQILGGICGECLSDADCDGGGCSLPNPISMPPVGAVCNDGGAGEGCMSDAVCQDGLSCAVILDVPGILTAQTCSECLTDADCADGMLCSPTYDVLTISGQKVCVEPGTVVNGEGCDFMGTGDDACMSGICAVTDIMGLLMVGVCGECEVDADCTAPDVCLPASVDTMTGVVTPNLCGMGM